MRPRCTMLMQERVVFVRAENRFHLVVSCLRSRSNAVALRWEEEHEEESVEEEETNEEEEE